MTAESVLNAIWSLIPTVFAGFILWLILRTILRADRAERRVYAEIQAQERRKAGLDVPADEPAQARAASSVMQQGNSKEQTG